MRKLPFGALSLALVLALAGCKTSEEKAEEFFQSGLDLMEQGDLDRAAVEFRNVFRYEGTHKAARRNLAEILLEQGQVEPAYGQYLRLAEQYPDDVETRIALAELAVAQNAWGEVERHGNVAIEAAPDRPAVQTISAALAYRDGVEAEDAEAREAAVERAEALLAADPELDIARRMVIAGRLEAGELEQALPEIETAIGRAPEDLDLRRLKLKVLADLDRPEAVEATLVETLEAFPDNAEVQRDLVAWHMRHDDLDAAEQTLRDIAGPAGAAVEGHLTVVRFLAETQGVPAAREELARLIEANAEAPEKLALYTALDARYAFNAGQRSEAIAAIREVLEAHPETDQTARLKTMLAEMLSVTGNRVAARNLVEEVLAEDERNVEALKLRANWLIAADKPGEAIIDLRSALDQAPRDPQILTLMARAHQRDGSLELAGERLALAVEVTNSGVMESLRYADFLRNQDRQAVARSVLQDAREAHPGNVDILTQLGRVALEQQATGEVRDVIGTLSQLDSEVARDRATALRAALLLQQQRVEEGISLLADREGADGSDAGAVLAVVRTWLQAGKIDKAREYFDPILADSPEDPGLRLIDAALDSAAGDPETAEKKLHDLVAEYPEAEPPARQLYTLMRRQGRDDEASQVLQDALKKMPDSRNLRLTRAGEFEAAGEFDAALELYEALYEENDDDLIVANNYASLLSNLRDDPKSLEKAEAVARRLRSSEVPAFRDTYGWIVYLNGDAEEALDYLEPAAEALSDNALVQYHLGMAYAELGRTDAARQALEKAISLAESGTLPQIETARETLRNM